MNRFRGPSIFTGDCIASFSGALEALGAALVGLRAQDGAEARSHQLALDEGAHQAADRREVDSRSLGTTSTGSQSSCGLLVLAEVRQATRLDGDGHGSVGLLARVAGRLRRLRIRVGQAFRHRGGQVTHRLADITRALVKDYGIAATRLRAADANLAPVASNASEEVRGRNRRVEMVIQ